MNTRIVDVPRNMFAKVAVALILAVGILCAAWAEDIHYTVKSGEPRECHNGGHWRVDANGKEWPVTIQYISRPRTERCRRA